MFDKQADKLNALANKHTKCAAAVRSNVTQQVAMQYANKIVDALGGDITSISVSSSTYTPEPTLEVTIEGKGDYLKLLSYPNSHITTKEVRTYDCKVLGLFTHGVTMRVIVMLSHNLDKDDILTLERLGKIKREVSPTYINEYVSCDV